MAKIKRRTIAVLAVALALIVVAAVVVTVVVLKRKNYTPVDDIDLEEYSFVGVEFERDFYLHEPEPEADLVFRNGKGEEKRALLSEAEVSGLSTEEIGTAIMTVAVHGSSVDAEYTVCYKNISYASSTSVCLSLYDPFELDMLFASCTDYYDEVVAAIPLSEIFSENLPDVDEISDTEQTATAEYRGFSFALSYTVGYLGYGNKYTSASVTDGVRSFRIEEFCLYEEAEQRGTPLGHGSFFLVTEGEENDDYGNRRSFDWELDGETGRLILHIGGVADDGNACVYDLKAHTLRIPSDVMLSTEDLVFRLRLDVPREA